jgi:hypothetical protein
MADPTQSYAATATTTPDYYTNYLSNLATTGTAAGAATNLAAWDPNALQNKAFTDVNTNVGNYQPGLTQANTYLGKGAGVDITGAANPYLAAGSSSAADLVGGYMNPYTSNVVDQIRMANQQNIAQNLSPGITAGAVGSGQFGSQRGANALALGISNADIGALSEQAKALQSGYAQSLAAAQAQRTAQLQAGQTAGNVANMQAQNLQNAGTQQMNLANQTQSQGLADVNALANLGAQKQTIAQNRQLAPLEVLQKQSAIMSGQQIPTTTTSTVTPSTLSTIAGLTSVGAGLNKAGMLDWLKGALPTDAGTGGYGNTGNNFNVSGQPGGSVNTTPPKVIADGNGGYVNTTTGFPVNVDGTSLMDQSGGQITPSTGGHYDYDYNTGNPIWIPD